MGFSISKVFDRLFGKKETRILILGLDSAGKSTILYKLKLGKVVNTIPTIGFNVETVENNNIKFTIWDLSRRGKIRALLKVYYTNTQGIIFVVDSSDRDRIEIAKEELYELLAEEELKDAALLVFANKQDLKGVMSVAEVTEKLGLHTLKNRDWHIQGTSAINGEGLYKGLDWLGKTLSKKK